MKKDRKKKSSAVMLPGLEPEEKTEVIREESKPAIDNKIPTSLSQLLKNYRPKDKNKYVSREFQDYGYRLAMELEDQTHVSMYIRLAKTTERGLLESARSFVIDSQARSKGRLFMWKLKQLKDEKKEKENSNQ